MEKLILNFEGHSELDKNDVVVEQIGEDGKMVRVDVSELSGEELIDKIDAGDLFINFEATYANTLDGSIELTLEEE